MQHVIVGIGGVGTHLVGNLARYLSSNPRQKSSMLLVDGDTVETGNLSRQDFGHDAVGENKATAMARKLRATFPSLSVETIPEYLTTENATLIVGDNSVVFIGVDNFTTKHIIMNRAKQLSDVLLIQGSNEITDGNVLIHHRKRGQDLTRPFDVLHPEIANPEDKHPLALSCHEAAISEPQLIFMNTLVSVMMLSAYWNIMEKQVSNFHEIFFDIDTMKMRGIKAVLDTQETSETEASQ